MSNVLNPIQTNQSLTQVEFISNIGKYRQQIHDLNLDVKELSGRVNGYRLRVGLIDNNQLVAKQLDGEHKKANQWFVSAQKCVEACTLHGQVALSKMDALSQSTLPETQQKAYDQFLKFQNAHAVFHKFREISKTQMGEIDLLLQKTGEDFELVKFVQKMDLCPSLITNSLDSLEEDRQKTVHILGKIEKLIERSSKFKDRFNGQVNGLIENCYQLKKNVEMVLKKIKVAELHSRFASQKIESYKKSNTRELAVSAFDAFKKFEKKIDFGFESFFIEQYRSIVLADSIVTSMERGEDPFEKKKVDEILNQVSERMGMYPNDQTRETTRKIEQNISDIVEVLKLIPIQLHGEINTMIENTIIQPFDLVRHSKVTSNGYGFEIFDEYLQMLKRKGEKSEVDVTKEFLQKVIMDQEVDYKGQLDLLFERSSSMLSQLKEMSDPNHAKKELPKIIPFTSTSNDKDTNDFVALINLIELINTLQTGSLDEKTFNLLPQRSKNKIFEYTYLIEMKNKRDTKGIYSFGENAFLGNNKEVALSSNQVRIQALQYHALDQICQMFQDGSDEMAMEIFVLLDKEFRYATVYSAMRELCGGPEKEEHFGAQAFHNDGQRQGKLNAIELQQRRIEAIQRALKA